MSCPIYPEITGTEWGERLRANLKGERYPLSCSMEITDRCNLKCMHCYINQPAGCKNAMVNELTLDQIITIFDQIAEAGCLFLLLTGGEIFLRKDFAEIYRYAKEKGFIVTLFTNGTLINDEIADLLEELPPSILEITLYGATEETYEKITGVKGSFNKCISGIETLLDHHVNVMLKSELIKENVHELEQMRSMAEDFGVSFRYDAMLWPRLDGKLEPFVHRLSVEEQLALDRADPERWQEWIDLAEKVTGELIRAERVYNCGAGYHSFHIDSNGKLSMCMMSRKPSYSILEEGFKDAWDKLGLERLKTRQLHTKCETCSLGSLCTQCPAWSQLVHSDFETPVEFLCELAHRRARYLQICDKIDINEEIISYE